jgi:polyhydroxybutyrate depolymerase
MLNGAETMIQRLVIITTLGLSLHASVTLADTSAYQVSAAGLERTYYLHVPPGAPADRSLPLVLVFHGGSGSPANIERETRFSELADREGFLVAYPEGYQKSFNDGRGVSDIPAQRDQIDDIAFVTGLIDDVAKKRRVDPKRIYATGISNGAMMSHLLGAKLSTKLAAIAPVAGSLAEPLVSDFEPTAPVSVLMFFGADDRFVPYGGGEVHPPGLQPRGRVIGLEQAARLWTERNGS